MQYCIKGKTSINLTQNDFLDKGLEGSIYVKGSQVIKIYHDLKQLIPEGKIRELQELDCKNIIVPKDIVLDDKNNYVGFTMRRVKDYFPLCKVFSNNFLKAENITKDNLLELVENIKLSIIYIHEKKCLLVDGNEMNYLVDKNKTTPYFIDTNSYKTKHYPATAWHPTTRDYHTKGFNEMSDWFIFGVISCKIFTGMHPFRGNHPKYRKNDLEKRMIDNISIFNTDVSLPKAARDFSYIPNHYLHWFIEIFEKGERKYPPSVAGKFIITTPRNYSVGNDILEIKLIQDVKETILYYGYLGSNLVIKTDKAITIQGKKYSYFSKEEIILTKRKDIPIFIKKENEKLALRDISIDLNCEDFMIKENRLYIKNEDKFMELDFDDRTDKLIPSIITTWNVLPNSTKIFSGLVYQNILGKPYLLIPYNGSKMRQLYIKELESYKIIDAKEERRVICVIGYKNNKYDKLIIRWDAYNYDCRILEDIENYINFTVLGNGICCIVQDNNCIELFRNVIGKNEVNKLDNTNFPIGGKLYTDLNKVICIKDNKIYSMRIK